MWEAFYQLCKDNRMCPSLFLELLTSNSSLPSIPAAQVLSPLGFIGSHFSVHSLSLSLMGVCVCVCVCVSFRAVFAPSPACDLFVQVKMSPAGACSDMSRLAVRWLQLYRVTVCRSDSCAP